MNSLQVVDGSSGENAPDIELIWLAAPYISHGQTPPPKDVEIFTMAAVMLKPQSKGSIKLSENSPFAPPTIDPQYALLSHTPLSIAKHGDAVTSKSRAIATLWLKLFV